jgi:hypothetical protein
MIQEEAKEKGGIEREGFLRLVVKQKSVNEKRGNARLYSQRAGQEMRRAKGQAATCW